MASVDLPFLAVMVWVQEVGLDRIRFGMTRGKDPGVANPSGAPNLTPGCRRAMPRGREHASEGEADWGTGSCGDTGSGFIGTAPHAAKQIPPFSRRSGKGGVRLPESIWGILMEERSCTTNSNAR